MEGRGRPGGILPKRGQGETQCSQRSLPPNLERVKQAIIREPKTKLTALLHHIDQAALIRALKGLKPRASAGIDNLTVAEYKQDLDGNIARLHEKVQSGKYRALPARRQMIPKADGSQRPLGILALEDKIVQRAVGELLTVIYEEVFVDFSYGFRPGRGPRTAVDALQKQLLNNSVSYVLDADLSKCFDSIDHEKMLLALAQRIADPRLLQLITQWLKVGVLESGVLIEPEEGTPQGAPISPILANVFLHYALDLWVERWRSQPGRGSVVIVRFADDFVMGLEYRADAQHMRRDLAERLARCGLKLNDAKTRLIEFGRFAAERRRRSGKGRPETFDFLGFTHYCSTTRTGRYMVKRKTQGKRLNRKLTEVRAEAHKRMHKPVKEQYRWLCSVLTGHYRYYGVQCNYQSLARFYRIVRAIWKRALSRRSRKSGMNWRRYEELLTIFPLPKPSLQPA